MLLFKAETAAKNSELASLLGYAYTTLAGFFQRNGPVYEWRN